MASLALSLCLAIGAQAQTPAPAASDATSVARKPRLSFGSFKSTVPAFPPKNVIKPLTAALEKLLAGQAPPKIVFVQEANASAEVTVSANIVANRGKYRIDFVVASTDDPSLNLRLPFATPGPRVGQAAAGIMATAIFEATLSLELRRGERLRMEAASQPQAEPETPTDTDAPAEGEEDPDPFFRPSLRGFVQVLGVATVFDKEALLAEVVGLKSTPRAFMQANLQPQLKTRGDHFTVAADLSIYGSSVEPKGLALINELYADAQYGPVRLLVGRRRVVWGSGLAINPTDALNPQKDPLTPDLQRTGALLLPMVDVTVGPFIFTAFMSMGVDTNEWALPVGLLTEKIVVGARGYMLFEGIDINLMYYRDQGTKRNLFGVAGSRFLNDWVEVHLEGMIRSGAPDLPTFPAVPGCGGVDATTATISGTALLGGRVHFDDQSRLVVEYLYNANGLDDARFDQLKTEAPCWARTLALVGGPTPPVAPDHPLGFPPEQMFLVRAHHIFLNYERPHLTTGTFEDVSVTAGAVISPVDFSAILQAGLGYSFSGRTMLTLRLMYWAGAKESEIGAWPARWLGMAGMRVSF